MYKFLLSLIFVVAFSAACYGQNWHQHGGQWHNHYHNSYHYHNSSVGYQPIIGYYPQGVGLGVGRVYVSPCRKYVRIGAYGGYWVQQGSPIYYDFRTGSYRRYYR